MTAGLLLLGATACEEHNHNHGPAPRSGYVTGKATDIQGRPLAGARIVVNNTQFHNSNILGQTDASGRYELRTTPGSWYVRGTTQLTFDGKSYTLDLHPDGDEAFAGSDGAVRNLSLKLAGPRTGEFGNDGFYGGQIEVFTWGLETEQVELTLEPAGKLLDGSTGKTLTRKPQNMYIDDVPLGKYKITARYGSAKKPLNVRIRNKNQTYAPSVTDSFDPAYPGAEGRYKLNVEVEL